MRYFFFFYFFINCFTSTAQINRLYPIKQNHLWGFIDEQGNLVYEPKYDAIAQKNVRWNRQISSVSPFRLVELNGQLGLIDNQFNEVVAPAWKEIRPINNNLFAVRSEDEFKLINRAGDVFLSNAYDDVQLIMNGSVSSERYYKVRKDSLWGIYLMGTGEVAAPQFNNILLSRPENDYFNVKKGAGSEFWGLVNQEGIQVLPFEFEDIQVLHRNCILAKRFPKKEYADESLWTVYDSLGQQILPNPKRTFRTLNQHLVAFKNQDHQWELFLFKNQKKVVFEQTYDSFLPLEAGFIKGKVEKKWSIIDSLGNQIIEPTFLEIQAFNSPLFRVFDGGWGLYSLVDGMRIPTEYQTISRFENGLARVLKDNNWGMVNDTGVVVIPTRFESFQWEENFLKAFQKSTMTVFELDENNRVIDEEFYEEVYNVRVGYDLAGDNTQFRMSDIRRAANTNNRRDARNRFRFNFNPRYGSPDTTQLNYTNWKFEKSPINERFALMDKRSNQAVTGPVFRSVRHVSNGRLSLVFTERTTATNQVATFATFPVDTACAMALFSHDTGKFITDFEMMGLRRHDFERGLPYAAFWDLEGKMGLIDRQGNQLKTATGAPFRCTFLDDFQNGKARFCQNGKFAVVEQPEDRKIAISNIKMLTHGFYITPNRPFENNSSAEFFFKNEPEKEIEWGYLDSLGTVLIEPQYEYANQFLDSVAVNKKADGWGLVNEENEVLLDFIYKGISRFPGGAWRVSFQNTKPIFFNKNGHEIIGLKYNKFGGFSDGMCKVRRDSLWGFVNEKGEEIIPCQFADAQNFSDGFAAVLIDENWIFINKKGEKVLLPYEKIPFLEAVGSFKNDLCWYKVGKFYGYFDKNGLTKIEPQFTKAFDFENGAARVVYEAKTGVIDTQGNWILPPKEYEVIFPFNEFGVAEIRRKFNQKRGLLGNNGTLLATPQYRFIDQFINGYARVGKGGGYGIIDTKGRTIIPAVYKDCKIVANGLVAVMPYQKQAWHYRNLKNERAFKGEFEKAESFTEGLAFVQVHEFDPLSKMWLDTLGKKVNPNPEHFVENYGEGIFGMYQSWGIRRNFRTLNFYYADAKGKNVFDTHFEEIKPFQNGVAPVKLGNRWGVLNRSGMMVIKPKYSRINMTDEGLLHTKPSLILGLTDSRGKEMLPPIYDDIRKFRNLIRVEIGEKIGYTTMEGEWIWEVQN